MRRGFSTRRWPFGPHSRFARALRFAQPAAETHRGNAPSALPRGFTSRRWPFGPHSRFARALRFAQPAAETHRGNARSALPRGFTLLEVMIALALLGLGMVVLIKSAAGNIMSTEDAHMMGIATDLARAKMYDIEEILLKDGFTDTSQSQEDEQCFEDEGWPNICYSYKVEEPKLPSIDQLNALAEKQAEEAASAAGSALGSDAAAGAPGGIFGMLGAFGGGKQDITAAQGASLIQSQYAMFQEILKVSVRKVTLTVKWKVLGRDRDMKVVAFFTDAAAMDKVLNGMGSQEYDPNAGKTNPTSPTSPTTPKSPTRPGSGG